LGILFTLNNNLELTNIDPFSVIYFIMRAFGNGDCLANVPHRAHREFCRHLARWLGYAIPTPCGSSVELATGAHLPVEDWTDVRIGQSLKINISLLRKVKNATGLSALV